MLGWGSQGTCLGSHPRLRGDKFTPAAWHGHLGRVFHSTGRLTAGLEARATLLSGLSEAVCKQRCIVATLIDIARINVLYKVAGLMS